MIGTASSLSARRTIGDGFAVGEHAEITIVGDAIAVAYTKDGGGIIGREQRIVNNVLYSRIPDSPRAHPVP